MPAAVFFRLQASVSAKGEVLLNQALQQPRIARIAAHKARIWHLS